MSEQKPSIGRIVHFHAGNDKGSAYPAVITHVWSDSCVNLNVFDDGSYPLPDEQKKPTSVMLATGDTAGLKHVWSWPPRV